MPKYISDLTEALKAFKAGVAANAALWAPKGITPESIQTSIDLLAAKNAAIEAAKLALAKAITDARDFQEEKATEFSQMVKIAYGFHADEESKLLDYGLEPRKDAQPHPAPSLRLDVTIEDDTDGQGYILSTNKDPEANMYEWHKGVSTDPTKLEIIPVMAWCKTTKKISFVDDDVVKGQRVWYKVRAQNTAGSGPWSEPRSRVQ
jgi:hypothetical protein